MDSETPADVDAQIFKFPPDSFDASKQRGAKTHIQLCDTEMLRGEVQVLSGRGANLHCHPNSDGMWFVLKGEAKFNTYDGEILGEFGPNEGVLVPRGYPYEFVSIGDEDLEILHVVATDNAAEAAQRIDFEGERIDNERREFVSGQVDTKPDPRA